MKLLLDCAMEIGEMMLISGAEVHRVEDSMLRICHALGAVRADVFIIPSSMVCTVHSIDGDVKTQTRRVLSLRTDYHKLDKLNRLSRKICSQAMTIEEIRAMIPDNYRINWQQHTPLPYIAWQVKRDFGIDMTEATHGKMVIERID